MKFYCIQISLKTLPQKNLSEVQSAHFGSSLWQVTLHTGVIHSSKYKSLSFCTISDNCDHGPKAVWSHLLPVLRYLQQFHPQASILHIVSDGPTTENNMYLCTVSPHALNVDRLRQTMLMEQFLQTVSSELKILLVDQKPKTIDDMARLADQYVALCKHTQQNTALLITCLLYTSDAADE